MVIEHREERWSATTVLVVEGDPAAVREALSRSGFAVRDEDTGSVVGAGLGTVMAVAPGDTLALPDNLVGDTGEQEVRLSAAAILARAGLSGPLVTDGCELSPMTCAGPRPRSPGRWSASRSPRLT
jgi:hypothetical protein